LIATSNFGRAYWATLTVFSVFASPTVTRALNAPRFTSCPSVNVVEAMP
jgi:hypothetical protein